MGREWKMADNDPNRLMDGLKVMADNLKRHRVSSNDPLPR
jgi:hypothetical protein